MVPDRIASLSLVSTGPRYPSFPFELSIISNHYALNHSDGRKFCSLHFPSVLDPEHVSNIDPDCETMFRIFNTVGFFENLRNRINLL